MKKLLLTAALVAGTIGVFAQGTVNFNNTVGGIQYRITDMTGANAGGGAAGQGTNFFAQLYWAAGNVSDSTLLAPAGNPVNLRSLANGGLVQTSGTTSLGAAVNSAVTLTGLTPAGGAATVQVRAWWNNNSAITSWYAADDPTKLGGQSGQSGLIFLAATGNPNASPPGTPADLVGLTAFQLSPVAIIPEPTTFALAGLGAAALLIFRRRK